jgi:hypothetical protein
MKITSVIILFVILISLFKSNAQGIAYIDPAKAYNKMMLDKNGEGANIERVGNFKVKGTSLYFGGSLKGTVFTKERAFPDVLISYNSYNQFVDIYDNSNTPIATKKFNELDSFKVKINTSEFNTNSTFISSLVLQSNDNCFFQVLSLGNKYSLYKKYHTDLGIVTENQFQADLRQFDLLTDYYYSESGVKGIKKIKLTNNGIIKEFKLIKDVSKIVEEGSLIFNPEGLLLNVFEEINK